MLDETLKKMPLIPIKEAKIMRREIYFSMMIFSVLGSVSGSQEYYWSVAINVQLNPRRQVLIIHSQA